MRVDSILQKSQVYLIAMVAVLLVSGISFVVSTPFSPEDYGVADASENSLVTSPTAFQESQPALLEPALRSLDGVAHHG